MTTERVGALTEVLHSVVYFAPEPLRAYEALGLRGYWRGYFASRAAALGTPSAERVTALFGGFAAGFVARAVPEVWSLADPEQVLAARRTGAVAALQRAIGSFDPEPAAQRTGAVVRDLELEGRPMAAAQAALPRSDEPLAALWHDCTVLREHRGDGHLAALAEAGLPWPEPHLLAADRVDHRQRELRGWSEAEWEAARRSALAREPDVVEQVEARTAQLAAQAYAGVDVEAVRRALEPLAAAVLTAGLVPFPNAMGLVSPSRAAAAAPRPVRGTHAAGA